MDSCDEIIKHFWYCCEVASKNEMTQDEAVKEMKGVILGTVLLDSGSETTLIRSGFAKQLGVQGQRQNLTVDTVGGVRTTLKSQRVCVPFAPAVTDINVYAWTMKNICEQSCRQEKQQWMCCLDWMQTGKHGQPCAELTPLGLVISGPVPTTTKPMKHILRVHVVDGEEDANHQLQKLWEIDSFGVHVEATTYTRSEQRAVDIMNETCHRVESGYELGLLWKADRPPLPNIFKSALSRPESVERRLQKDPKLADGYCKAIDAYVCTKVVA
ncbi:Pao retrotransposon peptidase superfamily [Paramuricea clavata]|uniref:Pao retrotransposon peptidase superfamily n=1 Tax=Paramuricea clavata TaxID=317549 RepID=A0A7D9JF31_PARCT|nr:Pao retrotransposon peptidase superfamily [Paramuricea clavata]